MRPWPKGRTSVSSSCTFAAAVRRKMSPKNTAGHTVPGEKSYPQIKADVRRLVVDISRCAAAQADHGSGTMQSIWLVDARQRGEEMRANASTWAASRTTSRVRPTHSRFARR